jgi:3-oxoacyl-[acyl-carrier-protein] synthase II
MKLYIHASSAISPQAPGSMDMLDLSDASSHLALEPLYTEYITPAMSRRMSRVIKMGVASGLNCLNQAELESPDAIITATGFGCFEDSLKFLESLIQNKETILSPTPFIQSTHNTIGAQIALLRSCYGYNNTHVHGGFSFENALIDSYLYLAEHPEHNILIGAADELTPAFIELKENENSDIPGSTANLNLGEGAAFFLVNKKSTHSKGVILKVQTIFNPNSNEIFEILTNLKSFSPDLILSGEYSVPKSELDLNELLQSTYDGIQKIAFKKYCGNYHTSGAFALWLATKTFEQKPTISNILIANQFDINQFSFIMLGRA